MPRISKKSLVFAVSHGGRLDVLIALQRQLAAALDESSSGRDIAALSRQLREVTSEIEAAQREIPRAKITALDEILMRHGKPPREYGHAEPNEDD